MVPLLRKTRPSCMAKSFGAEYERHMVVLTVGDSIECKNDAGHVFFSIPPDRVCLAGLADRKSVRLNWFEDGCVKTVLVKSKHAAAMAGEIRSAGAACHAR